MSLTPLGSFDDPIFATAPRADASSLYVVQRGGQVRIVRNGSTLAQPFLDISADVDPAGEGGLLSLAFPTDYSTSGLFYVYLTANDANPGQAPHAPIQVREYRRSASDPNRADPASGRIVLSIPHAENTNHYGGTLQFGDDGRLYAGTGDGGGGGDPSGNAQNPESMLGKILRLDPRRNGEAAYGVPQDNPYAARPSSQLVWSTGLRNPYRFAFDRSTGALLIGDVGQNRFEEIDSVPGPAAGRGLNFGWRTCEGTTTYPSGAQGSCATPGLTGPVFEYGHDGGRCSITGGVVSRDPGVEELAGRYLYSDYCAPDVRSQVPGNPASDASTGLSAAQAAAYGEDACGRVHVIRLPGTVGRITDGSAGACALRPEFTPAPAQPGSTLSRPVPAAVTLKTRIARRQKVLRRRYRLAAGGVQRHLLDAGDREDGHPAPQGGAAARGQAPHGAQGTHGEGAGRQAGAAHDPQGAAGQAQGHDPPDGSRPRRERPPDREAPEHPDRGLGRATGAPYGTPVRWFVCGRRAGEVARGLVLTTS